MEGTYRLQTPGLPLLEQGAGIGVLHRPLSILGWTLPKGQKFVAAHRGSRAARRLAKAAQIYLDGYENLHYEGESNGEYALLARLGQAETIVDVGANRGDWAARAAECFPQADIHCFEIVSHVARELEQRFAGNPRIHVNPMGLSNQDGEVEVTTYRDDRLSSIIPDFHREGTKAICMVTTGVSYLEAQGISQVDIVKLDVEGSENLVLEGLKGILMDAIQFEYGRVNIVSHFLLRDFYEVLEGYVIGKIYPNGVDFRDYELAHEDFRGPNYLAIRKGSRYATNLGRL